MKEIKYGLMDKETKKLVGYSAESNEPGDNVSISYELDMYSDDEWLVDTPEHAEYVRLNSTEWYNADYNTPENGIEPEKLQVVKVEIEKKIEPIDVKIPNFEEYMKGTYKDKDPNHLKYVLGEYAKHPDMKYLLYELKEYIKRGK